MARDFFVLGLAGKTRGGKDTVARVVADEFGFYRLAFADTIKDMLCAMLTITRNELERRKDDPDYRICPDGPTIGEAMQTLGTEWGQDMVSRGIWVHIVKTKILAMMDGSAVRCFVVPDVREEHEADWVRRHGQLIHVVGDPHTIVGRHSSGHRSERGIKRQPCDGQIGNGLAEDVIAERMQRLIDWDRASLTWQKT